MADIHLHPFRGTLTDREGNVLPGSFVKVRVPESSVEFSPSEPTDQYGQFTIEDLPPTHYQVVVLDPQAPNGERTVGTKAHAVPESHYRLVGAVSHDGDDLVLELLNSEGIPTDTDGRARYTFTVIYSGLTAGSTGVSYKRWSKVRGNTKGDNSGTLVLRLPHTSVEGALDSQQTVREFIVIPELLSPPLHFGLLAAGDLADGMVPARIIVPRNCLVRRVLAFVNAAPDGGALEFAIGYREKGTGSPPAPGAPVSILETSASPFQIPEGEHYMETRQNGFRTRAGWERFNLLEGDVLELMILNAGGAEWLTVTLECED